MDCHISKDLNNHIKILISVNIWKRKIYELEYNKSFDIDLNIKFFSIVLATQHFITKAKILVQ